MIDLKVVADYENLVLSDGGRLGPDCHFALAALYVECGMLHRAWDYLNGLAVRFPSWMGDVDALRSEVVKRLEDGTP